MRKVRVSFAVYRKQEPCKSCYETCMGRLYGNMWGYPAYRRNEGAILTQKRNDWKNLWNGKGKPRISIYAVVWQSADDNESRAYVCVHEFKKACKMQAGMGITDGIIQGKISCFRNKFHKHKEKCSEKRKFLGALCLRSEEPAFAGSFLQSAGLPTGCLEGVWQIWGRECFQVSETYWLSCSVWWRERYYRFFLQYPFRSE